MLTTIKFSGKLVKNGRSGMEFDNKLVNCKYIVKQIKDLGVDDKYLGFYFLVSIEEMLINGKSNFKSFYKDVYPEIALQYKKNACTIERNIRHLINQHWLEGDKFLLYKVCPGDKPSCCKFIYAIKNYLMKQIV